MRAPKPVVNRVLTPAGTFMARVIRVIYIGTVKETYMGEPKETPKIMLTWELPTELHVFEEGKEPKPFTISKEYTHSMGKKSNLLPVVKALIGTSLDEEEAFAFDHDDLVGLACQITITHDEKDSGVYARVGAVGELLKGVICPPQVNESKILSFEKWDEKLFESLPKFIKDKIVTSREYKLMKGLSIEEPKVEADEIPF